MNDDISNKSYSPNVQLEPRVAKLELGMERLTDDIKDLAQVVRAQGSQMEQEIQKLVVSVTQAAGPRQTDWSTIIAAVMLIMAIGSAAFWPLNQAVNANKDELSAVHALVVEHKALDNHPVGSALLSRIEEQLKLHEQLNQKEITDCMSTAEKEHESMMKSFQATIDYNQKLISESIKIETKVQELMNERLSARVTKLEQIELDQINRDKNELLAWKHKAMGLTDNVTK